MIAIALSMAASDYNRDAIVICMESVAVFCEALTKKVVGLSSSHFPFFCLFLCAF